MTEATPQSTLFVKLPHAHRAVVYRQVCWRRRVRLGPAGGDAMLETIIVVLLILWLLGFFGRARMPRLRRGGNAIHILLVIILVLIVIRLLP